MTKTMKITKIARRSTVSVPSINVDIADVEAIFRTLAPSVNSSLRTTVSVRWSYLLDAGDMMMTLNTLGYQILDSRICLICLESLSSRAGSGRHISPT